MNKDLENYARQKIKDGTCQLPQKNQDLFKRMYGSLETPIAVVIDTMEADKLDWAMQQVQRTFDKFI